MCGAGILAGSRLSRRLSSSKQIVQGPRLALLVFLQCFPRHATNDVSFLGKALLPGLFVAYRCHDLPCNRILLILGSTTTFSSAFSSSVDMPQSYQRAR
jgi:hypothetical protein